MADSASQIFQETTTMMLAAFAYLFLAVSLLAAYWFMVRPLLKARPAFAEFYAIEGSWWGAVWLKLDSIKTKLLAVLLVTASVVIELHDFLLPFATGLDWTPLTSRVPPAAWPFVSAGGAALFFWLRQVTARSQDKKFIAVEAGVITAKQAISGTDPVADAEVRAMPEPPVAVGEKE